MVALGRRFAVVAVVSLVVLGGQLGWATSASAASPATTFAQVKAAFTAGEDVTLGADISVSDSSYLTVGSGRSVTLDLHGHALSITNANGGDAAVGVVAGSSLTIEDTVGGGTLVAGGGAYSAGIGGTYDGGADVHNAGTITITGGTITATSVDYGAGIGGSEGGAGGNVTISGGTVTTTGGAQGAGIGGGAGGDGGSTLITGGTATATGGGGAAGIGSGDGRGNSAGPISITGGFVTATGGDRSAGIGGGYFGNGGQVVIGADARVVAINGSLASAIGNGSQGTSFGSLDNRGLLTVPAGSTLTVPAATASNSGTINLGGTLNGAGTVTNTGSILLGGRGVVANDGDGQPGHLDVTTHNYTLTYDVNGAQSAAPAAQHIYATTLTADAQDVAAAPTKAGSTFTGWFTSATGGLQVTRTTDLSGLAASGPSPLPLTAHYTLDSETVTFDTDGGTTIVGQTVPYGTTASRPTDPTKTSFTFDDWYATPTGGAPFDFSTPITADTTLYARYLGDQTITFTAPTDAIVGQDYPLTATGGASGEPVTFSTASTTCTVTGSTVTFSHTGSCAIDADQAGDADYTAAPTVEQVVMIAPAAQTISVSSNPPAHPVVGSTYSVIAAGGSSGQPVTATVDPASAAGACTVTTAGLVSLDGLGDCTIDLAQAGDTDYLPATAAQTITIDTVLPAFSGGMDQVLPGGTVGVDYTTNIVDSGTPAPLDTVADGALPPGLVLTGDPVLSGVPTTAGTFTFTLAATNRGGSARARFTMTVAAPVIATTPPVIATSPPVIATSPIPTSTSTTSATAPTTSPITSTAPIMTTNDSTTVSSSSTASLPVVVESATATTNPAATATNPQLASTGPGLPIWPVLATGLMALLVGAAVTAFGRRRQH